jgi:hypothetical protein
MNIIQIQDDLKGVPDQALVGYVQNPTGQVPTYLALSELERRKSMREKYQQAQPEKKTVAESIIEEAQPQMPQGLAQLPEAQPMMQAMAPPPEMPVQQMAQGGLADLGMDNDMFNEESFATGGIVAFADGGDTETHLNVNTGKQQSVNANAPISKYLSAVSNIMPWLGPEGSKIYASKNNAVLPWWMQVMNGSISESEPKSYTLNVESGKQEPQYAHGGEVQHYADGGTPSILQGGPTQESLPWYSGINDWLNRNFDWSATNRAAREKGWESGVTNPFISGQPRTDIVDEYLRLKQKVATGKGSYQDIERMKQIESQGTTAPTEPSGGGWTPGQKTPADIQAAKDAEANLLKDKDKALKNMAKNYTGGAPKESVKSLADYANEFKSAIGEDPFQSKLMDRMDKMDAAAAKQAEQAPWMALAEAGFTMAAGKSPHAMQNIAEGAIKGVKSYSDAKDKATQLEEKRFGLMADIAKAKRAEQIAIASKGADSRDAALAREQTERLTNKKIEAEFQLHILDNTYNLQEKALAAAAKDQPDATARATKIWPLVPEQQEYKDKMKALVNKLGDDAPTPGTRNHNKYLEGRQAIENEVYNNLIRKPGMGTTGATYNYVPGKGIMPL